MRVMNVPHRPPASVSPVETRQWLALREAALAVSADLSLAETLKRIVAGAAELVNAQYAAIGVPDESGELLVEFVFTGLSEADAARISHRPQGRGLLGLILREARSLRLRNLKEHPRSAGFPPHHPIMTSFLGVPILYQGKSVGNLYLADKRDADEFSESDQALIELLATHAANAIRNARLHQTTVEHSQALERRNRELAALNAVALATSQHLDLNQVMQEALDHVLSISGAEAGEIFLQDSASGDMVLALHRGAVPESFWTIRRFRRGEGFPGRVAVSGEPLVSFDLANDVRFLRRQVVEAGFTAFACLPLAAKGKVVGALGLAARRAQAFDDFNLSLLTAICHQIGVAAENARLYEQVQQLRVIEERQRIGMDLHDGVIQSIYAVGLTLEYVSGQLAEGDAAGAAERLRGAMEALNNTIRDIRAYILDLRPRRFEGDNLIEGLQRLLTEFKANTLMGVEFTSDAAADRCLTPEARLALFHIAQEALSNAARHSRASKMEIRLLDTGAEVVLALKDNGRGFDPDRAERRVGHGLMNMRDRALALGGELTIESPNHQGTEVRVRLPKPAGV
jgi:signal transduction histidine kinase